MRDLFPEYYTPSDEEFSLLWKKGTFVFDTNVLLHFYRYTAPARDDLLRVIESLQERIWLPHQVGWEFSKNRTSVIFDQNKIFDLVNLFDTFVRDKFENDIVQKYGKRGHSFADLDSIRTIFQKTKQELQEELDQAQNKQPDPLKHDPVLELLDVLLKGRIGPAYSKDEMDKLTIEFAKRYEKKIPPGFKDKKKNTSKTQEVQPEEKQAEENNPANIYGDVILWFQIIEYAKQEKKPIIFVVDDAKEDWWEKIQGKKRGPRAELRREIQEKATIPFYMYDVDNFIRLVPEYFPVQVSKETIDEVRESRIQDVQKRKQGDVVSYVMDNTWVPRSTLLDMIRQTEAVKQTVDALGGPARLVRDMQAQQAFFRQIQPFLPRSDQQHGEEESQEILQDTEEDEQDQEQQDNSEDGNT